MAVRRRARVLGIAAGAAGLRAALHEFEKGGGGLVTGFTDGLTRCLKGLVDEDGPMQVHLVGEVVSRYLKLCDEEPMGQARSGQYFAAISAACAELGSDSRFAKTKHLPGFQRALMRTLRELHSWRIGPDELEQAAELAEAGRQRGLFLELADIERTASRTLSELGREMNHTHIERALDSRPSEKVELGRLFVAAGCTNEPLAATWVKWLSDIGVDVTVAAEIPTNGLFGRTDELVKQLGFEFEPLIKPNELCAVLFTEVKSIEGPEVVVASAADMLSEAEWTLRSCKAELSQGKRLAIYARDLEGYGPVLQAAAQRLDVKLHISRRAPVLSNRFARLVLETLLFCSGDDPRLIQPLIRCSYLAVEQEGRDRIAVAAREAFRARKNAWPIFLGWAEGSGGEWPWLARLLQWRQDATREPLPSFAWLSRLTALMDLLPWHRGASEGPTTKRDIHAQSALQRSVAQVASIRRAQDEAPLSLREFASLCAFTWEDETYTIPSEAGEVAVRSDAQALGDYDCLFALGMLEGVFPRRRSEDAILCDADRAALSDALQLPVPLQTSFDRARQEREEFFRVCSAAREKLVFSYPLTDDTRDNVAAFYLHEVERAARTHSVVRYPRIPFAPSPEDAIADADRRLAMALGSPPEQPLPVELVTEQGLAAAAWPEEWPFSPQDMKSAAQCEFRQLAGRRLQLRAGGGRNRWLSLASLPKAARLMHQPDAPTARVALEQALEAHLDDLYGDLSSFEIQVLRKGGRRLIREWVSREFEARVLWKKDPDSTQVDVSIGSEGLRDTMKGGIKLRGEVAGISKMGPYRVAHLYEYSPPESESKFGRALSEADALYYGLYLLSRYGTGEPLALEVETIGAKRTLVALPRVPHHPLASRQQRGLEVLDLGGSGDANVARRQFLDEVNRRMARTATRLRQSGIEPMPGKHCSWCSFGELCRRASEFGETDSPFEERDGLDDL